MPLGDALADATNAEVGDFVPVAVGEFVPVTEGVRVGENEAVGVKDGDEPELDDFEGVAAAVPETDGVPDFEGVLDGVLLAVDVDVVAAEEVADRVVVRDTDAVPDFVGVDESDEPADGVSEHEPGTDEPSEEQPHGHGTGDSDASGQ